VTHAPLFFAGSFNPIHHGHLIIARTAAEAVGADRVVILPSAQNPLKNGDTAIAGMASCEDRLNMCRLAVASLPGFEVSELELRRSGPSYTIDTVQQLKLQGYKEIHWLMGTDQLATLPKWREIDRLLSEVRFVIAARPGFRIDWTAFPAQIAALQSQVVNAPLLEISATEIRRRVAASLPIDFLSPPSVVRYIRENGLYREEKSAIRSQKSE
jgi:nicotinate-nucleotide adenylyltransferase